MNCKNVLKKVGVSIFSGVMALSIPMATASALTQAQENAFITKYSNMIQDDHASIMSELLHRAVTSVSDGDVFNMQAHLGVVDYGELFDIVNNDFVDELHMTWSRQAIIDAATERFPEAIRSEIIRDYHDRRSNATAAAEVELLRSFLRISDSVRTELIQRCTINDMHNLDQYFADDVLNLE